MAELIGWGSAQKRRNPFEDTQLQARTNNTSSPSLNRVQQILSQTRSRGPVAPQNLDVRDRNYGGTNTSKFNTTATNNVNSQARATQNQNVTPYRPITARNASAPKVTGQFQTMQAIQPKLTTNTTLNTPEFKTALQPKNQQPQSDSWFSQVEDGDKLRHYYEEELKKNNDKAGFFGGFFNRVFDGGQAAATAKTEALNRYNQDLLRRAYDDNGKVVDTKAYAELKGKTADLATQTAAQSHQVAQAQTNRMGANDLDQDFGKRFLHTMEAINGMDMASGFVGVNDPEKFGIDDIGRFALNLPAGIVTSPITGARNAGRAISGRGLNAETGEMEDLSGLQRVGAAVSSAMDLVSPFIGGSGTLLKNIATSGSKQAGKVAAKKGAIELVKRIAKEGISEGAEEAVQNLAEELNEQGGWDEGTLGRTLQSAGLGALGGSVMSGAGMALGAGKAKLSQQKGLRGLIDDAKSTVDSRMKDVGETLGSIMPGNNNQRLAYAGGGELANQDIINNNNNIRTNMTIERGAAPDGSDLVKIDNKVFDGVPNDNKAKAKALRDYLREKFQGKSFPLNGGRDGEAQVTSQGVKKVSRSGAASTQGKVAGNLDEILEVSKIDPKRPYAKDTKNHALAKDGFEYRTSYVDVDGDVYQVRSNIALNDSKKTFYTLNRYGDENPPAQIDSSNRTGSSGGNFHSVVGEVQPTTGTRTPANAPASSIAQEGNNVNTKNASDMGQHTGSTSVSNISQNGLDVNTKSQLDTLYKQYGSDFYENLPAQLRDSYDAMLDAQPRDKNGVYTDPITGEKWVDEVIEGGAPDGSNLVKTDHNLSRGTSANEIGQAIKRTIQERFQGNSYKIGETDNLASITAKSREELGFKQRNMSNADFVKKGSMIGNLDELIENMSDVREIPNRKPDQKPNVDHYLSGRVAVDLGDGEIYYPRIDIEVSRSGNIIGYNIADIKRFPLVNSTNPHSRATNSRVDNGGTSRTSSIIQDNTNVNTQNNAREFPRLRPQGSPSRATNSRVDDTGTHSRISSVAQNDTNVNSKTGSLTVDENGEIITNRRALSREALQMQLEERNELKAYHEQYGSDFYEKLPEDLQIRYEEMLENAPRSKDGTYTDPITGEKWIDEDATNGSNWVRQPSKNSNEVASIESVVKQINSGGKRTFTTILRGASKRVSDVVKNAIGRDVSSFDHTIDNYAMQHALNKHKNDRIPLKESDFGLVKDIIKTPDSVEYSSKDNGAIVYKKQYDNRIVYLEEVRNKRHELAMKTMYWQEATKNNTANSANPHPEVDTDSLRASSRRVEGVNGSIVSQDSSDVNKSKFSTDTALHSEELSDNFRAQLESNHNNDSKTYKTFTDQSALENTAQFLKGKTLTEAESDVVNRLNKKLGTADKQDISDALAVVKQLERKGDTASFERAEQILDKVSQHATKSGQNIQALSLLSHKTPEGLLYGATKELKKNNVKVTTEIRQKLQENIKSIADERRHATVAQRAMENASRKIDQAIKDGTTTDFTSLIKEMKEAGKCYQEADDRLSYSYARLSKTVADRIPQSAGSIYSTLIKGGMLSAPTTHGKNITSNATFMGMRKASELVGAGVDKVTSAFTGKRSTAFTLRGEGEGAVRGTRYAINTLKTGLEEGVDSSKYGSGFAELKFKNKAADFVLGKPNRAVFRLMSAGDKAFRYAGQTNSLYKQALVAGKNQKLKGQALEAFVTRFVNNPSAKALSKAMDAGERAVLGQQNKVASAISNFIQTLKKNDSTGVRGIGTYIDAHLMPFVKVPTNFLTEAMSYTPLQLGAEMSHQIDSVRTGRGFDQESFSNSLGKTVVGTGVIAALAVGVQIADSVEISGDYPDDATEQARWQAEGIQENSIKIGDRWYKLEALGPFALFAGAGVNFKKSLDQGMGALDATATALANFTSALADQSFLTGISEATELLNGGMDVGTAGTSWARSQVSTLVPNIVKKAASATDKYQRAYDSHAGLGTNALQAIAGSMPIVRQLTLDKKVDVYGNELKNQSYISGFLDPTGSSKALQQDNEVIQEVARLKRVAEENTTELDEDNLKLLSATPNKTKVNLSSGGENYTLTDKQARELQTLTGQKITQVYRETMGSERYQNASDLDKAAMLKQAKTAATTLAKYEFAGQNDFSQSKLTGDAKKLNNNNFTANATAEGTGSKNGRSLEISDALDNENKKVLEQYNAMEKEDWEKHIYTSEGREAEYRLAEAKYANDQAKGEVTATEKVKREKELRRLKSTSIWNKETRDLYGLAGSKTDIQTALDESTDAGEREQLVAELNALNRKLYDDGLITASTYKSRNRNINNMESATEEKARTAAQKKAQAQNNAAIQAYMKALTSDNRIKIASNTRSPNMNLKMAKATLDTSIKKQKLGAAPRITVKKG